MTQAFSEMLVPESIVKRVANIKNGATLELKTDFQYYTIDNESELNIQNERYECVKIPVQFITPQNMSTTLLAPLMRSVRWTMEHISKAESLF